MNVGNYRIIEQVGEGGGMGTVYVAMHPVLDTRAIKKLHSHLAENATILRKFEDEARSLNKLKHPNIVEVYDFFEEDGDYYIVMEYVKGDSLSSYLRGGRPLPVKLALDYFSKILDAIGYAHDKGIIHRDVKPSNILISSDSGPKVVDFGIARILAEGQDRSTTTSVIGSPAYMAPEQFQGKADARTDVYALGITLFEMLTGRVPFNDKTPYKVARMHEEDPVPSVREFDPRLSPVLDEIIGKATEKSPKDRYQTAMEFKLDVVRFLRGTPMIDQGSARQSQETGTAPNAPHFTVPGGDDSATTKNPTPFFSPDATTQRDETEDLNIELPGATEVLRNIDADKPPKDARGTMTELMGGDFSTPPGKSAPDPQRTEFVPENYVKSEEFTQEFSFNQPKKSFSLDWIPKDDRTKILGLGGAVLLALILFIWWLFSGPSVQEFTLSAGEVTFHSAELNWPAVEGASFYTINRKQLEDGQYVEIDRTPTNNFTDEAMAPNQQYFLQIQAFDANRELVGEGEGRISTPGVNLQMRYEKDGKDLIFKWRNPSGKQVELATVNDAGEYEYLFRDSGENFRWRGGADRGDGVTLYALVETPSNPEYLAENFVLRVPSDAPPVNIGGSDKPSRPIETKPSPPPVAVVAPGSFRAERSGSSVIMSWIPSGNSHQVEIRKRVAGRGNFSTLARLDGNSTGHRDSEVSDEISYDYAVRTVYEGRRSGATRIITVPAIKPVAPSAPTDLSLAAENGKTITLNWRSGGNQSVLIQRRVSDAANWENVHTAARGKTTWADNNIQAGATYQYRLIANENGVSSSPGGSKSISIKEPVSTPEPPVAAADNKTLLEQGRQAIADNQISRATQLLSDVTKPEAYIDQKKYYAPARKLLGVISSQTGQDERAIRYFNEALEIDGYVADTHYYLAQALFNQKKYAEAISHYQKVNEYKKTLAADANRRILMESEYQIMLSTYYLWDQAIGEDDRNRFVNDFLRRANAFKQRYRSKSNDARYGSREDMQTKFDNIAIYERNVRN